MRTKERMEEVRFTFSDEQRRTIVRVLKLKPDQGDLDPDDEEGDLDPTIGQIEAWVDLYRLDVKLGGRRPAPAAEKKAMDAMNRAGVKFHRLLAKVDTSHLYVDEEAFRAQLEHLLRNAALADLMPASKRRPEAFEWLVGRLADLFEGRRDDVTTTMSYDDSKGVYRRTDFYVLVEACEPMENNNLALGSAIKRALDERQK
jgi:hypothetical protein